MGANKRENFLDGKNCNRRRGTSRCLARRARGKCLVRNITDCSLTTGLIASNQTPGYKFIPIRLPSA